MKRLVIFSAVLLLSSVLFMPQLASANPLTSAYVRLNRMEEATSSSLRLVFTTSSLTQTEEKVKLSLPDSFTVATSGHTASVATCPSETGADALPGTFTFTSSNSNGTKHITISGVTNLTASSDYCVDLTKSDAVTTPSAGLHEVSITTQTSGAADIDTVELGVRTVSNDEISVTATVPPTFNFVLDGNSDAFTADLTSGTKRQTSGRTVTVNTNATTGWIAWARNDNSTGLFSASQSKDIAGTTPGVNVNVDAALTTEQYVWGVSNIAQGTGAGTTSADTAYDATGSNEGSGLDTTYRRVASSTGTAASAVITLRASATISPLTPAASDYADIINVIGAGSF